MDAEEGRDPVMKKQLCDELIVLLRKHLGWEEIEEVRMGIEMILHDYHVDQEERALVEYEQDETIMVIKKFLAAKISKGCTPRTIDFYRNAVVHVLGSIGKPYNKVTADDIRYYLAKRVQQDGVTKTTANNERRAVSAFYSWLQMEEILLKNPMNKVENIKDRPKKKKAFSRMELEKLRYECKTKRETAMIELLISTWCRVSEVVQIKISDIEDRSIIVHGKGEKDREVYLTPKASLSIKKYLEERSDDNPYLFPRAKYAGDMRKMKKSKKWYAIKGQVDDEMHMDKSSFEATIRNIGRRAGVPKTHPHRFRRTGATMALRAGMPILKVSKLLGHEQIGTTQRYLDISDEELMDAHKTFVT